MFVLQRLDAVWIEGRSVKSATRAAARVFGLDFVALVRERYDLVLRRKHLDQPEVQALFETLGRSSFRRELEALGGYDTSPAGTEFC